MNEKKSFAFSEVISVKAPVYTTLDWFKYIAIRVVFFPILLFDALSFLVNAIFGGYISRMVLPAQSLYSDDSYDIARLVDLNTTDDQELIFRNFAVKTHDGALLDTFEIQQSNQCKLPANNKKYIIRFCANAMSFNQSIEGCIEEANQLGCNVVLFNYRGVGKSTSKAWCQEHLFIDGIAQVQRLLDLNVKPENILLDGLSLGGVVATFTASHFNRLGMKVNVLNDRSLSSVTNFLLGHIRTMPYRNGHQESLVYKTVGYMLWPLLWGILQFSRWNMDAASQFKSIPEECKEYIVVRTPKSKRTSIVADDLVMCHYGSLHYALKTQRRYQKTAIQQSIDAIDHAKLGRSDSDVINNQASLAMKEKIRHLGCRKFQYVLYYENAHTVSREFLRSQYQVNGGSRSFTAQDHARTFAKRVLRLDDTAKKNDSELGFAP